MLLKILHNWHVKNNIYLTMGLNIWGAEHNRIYWKCKSKVPQMPELITHHVIFTVWKHGGTPSSLQLAQSCISFYQMQPQLAGSGENKGNDPSLRAMIAEIIARVHYNDTTCSMWCTEGGTLEVWVDASSLVTRI